MGDVDAPALGRLRRQARAVRRLQRQAALKDRFQRRAQPGGGSEQCVMVNLTDFGARYHDITPGDDVVVEVREDEIAIRKHSANTRQAESAALSEF